MLRTKLLSSLGFFGIAGTTGVGVHLLKKKDEDDLRRQREEASKQPKFGEKGYTGSGLRPGS